MKPAQLPLVPIESSVYSARAEEFLRLLNQAVKENGMQQDVLAHLTRRMPSQLSKMLGGNGNHPSPDVIMAVMDLDTRGVLLSGLAGMHGREVIERRVDPIAENRALRQKLAAIQDEIGHLLGDRR